MSGYMDISMHLIGWNEKGPIGFEVGGRYLSYLSMPDDEEEMDAIKEQWPYISPEMVRDVNKYQDDHK